VDSTPPSARSFPPNRTFRTLQADQSAYAPANTSTETLVNPLRAVQLSDLQILRGLGQGTFGQVFSVKDKVSKKTLALKVMKKAVRSESDLGLVIAEQKVLKKTKDCPWFISLEASFHDTANFYFLMVRIACHLYVSASNAFNLSATLSFGPGERDMAPGAVRVSPCTFLHV
jgi:hypothetical protein